MPLEPKKVPSQKSFSIELKNVIRSIAPRYPALEGGVWVGGVPPQLGGTLGRGEKYPAQGLGRK
jgi:hypothetical protein